MQTVDIYLLSPIRWPHLAAIIPRIGLDKVLNTVSAALPADDAGAHLVLGEAAAARRPDIRRLGGIKDDHLPESCQRAFLLKVRSPERDQTQPLSRQVGDARLEVDPNTHLTVFSNGIALLEVKTRLTIDGAFPDPDKLDEVTLSVASVIYRGALDALKAVQVRLEKAAYGGNWLDQQARTQKHNDIRFEEDLHYVHRLLYLETVPETWAPRLETWMHCSFPEPSEAQERLLANVGNSLCEGPPRALSDMKLALEYALSVYHRIDSFATDVKRIQRAIAVPARRRAFTRYLQAANEIMTRIEFFISDIHELRTGLQGRRKDLYQAYAVSWDTDGLIESLRLRCSLVSAKLDRSIQERRYVVQRTFESILILIGSLSLFDFLLNAFEKAREAPFQDQTFGMMDVFRTIAPDFALNSAMIVIILFVLVGYWIKR